MRYLTKERCENSYLMFGAVCLVLALLGAFGAVFSSIGFAFYYAMLVAAPLVVGLLGAPSHLRIFPFLVLFACATTVVGILVIYSHDAIKYPSSRTSFIHEPVSWVWLLLNLAEALFAAIKLRKPAPQNGD